MNPGNVQHGLSFVLTLVTQHSVLIDDRIELAKDWEEKGGIFIHHTDTARTLRMLRQHGIIPEETVVEAKSKVVKELERR